MSQILFIGFSFCFMKSRTKCLKNTLKVSRFSNKIKTRAYIRNLRHSSLHTYVVNISRIFHVNV